VKKILILCDLCGVEINELSALKPPLEGTSGVLADVKFSVEDVCANCRNKWVTDCAARIEAVKEI